MGEELEGITGLTSAMTKPQERIVNVPAAIHPLRVVLRETEYFNGKHQEFMSTSGQDIQKDLLEFTDKSTLKKMYRMKKEYMRETKTDILWLNNRFYHG